MRGRLRLVAESKTFTSLRVPNYRRYFIGQLISVTGVWMQVVALSWLTLDLTGSGTSLGLVIGARFVPVLLLGPYAGLVADRMDKRTVLRISQSAAMVLALLLALLCATDTVTVWMVYAISVGFGIGSTVDGPARQTFISELVGLDNVRNAVTLNSVMIYIAQIVGPAVGGVVINVSGVALCFLINAISTSAVLVSLALLDPDDLQPAPREERAKGQIREGLRYVRHNPELLATMVMIVVAGTFAWEYQITLPLIAKDVFGGNASSLGWLMSSMGGGAVVGGLIAASRPTATARTLALACMLWGVTLTVAAAAPNLGLGVFLMLFVGFGTISFSATSKSTLQLVAEPRMRGRVVALWSVCVSGSTPIGAPIVGWIGQHFGARWSLVAGGVPTLVVGGAYYVWFKLGHAAPEHADAAVALLNEPEPAPTP